MTQAPLSFDLNQEMLTILGQKLDVEKLVSRLAEAVAGKQGREAEEAAKGVLEEYGKEWGEADP